MPTLSVVIIVQDEEPRISACLESVSWVDEIVVLDSGSTDNTLEICKQYTDKVFINTDWQGFGIQKNRALEYAGCDWVLSLDADERVSAELRQEIEQSIGNDQRLCLYEIPRLSSFCGKTIRSSGWWPDHVARLFPNGEACFSDDIVHERVESGLERARLKSPIHHESTLTLESSLDKMDRYSTAGAEKLYQEGRRATLFTAFLHAFSSFIRTYILKRGFRDGVEGVLIAIGNAEGAFYKYAKLYYLNKKRKNSEQH